MTHEERQKLREAARAATDAVDDPCRHAFARGRGDWELQTSNSVDDPCRHAFARGRGDWELQTSNSFRRIGAHGDGDVLCAVTQRSDNHPDLHAAPAVLKYIVAAQPAVVLSLLDQLDVAEMLLSKLSEVEARLDETDRKFREAQFLVEQLQVVAKGELS